MITLARFGSLLMVVTAVLSHSQPAAAEEEAEKKPSTLGKIERLDPRFDKLIPADAQIEQLAEGFDWAEGPVWDKKAGVLLFSDIPPNKVMQWSDADGLKLFLHPAGYTGSKPRGGEPGSNGLLFNRDGQLVLCQHGDRRIARLGADGKFETLADRWEGKRFNSPNDAVFHSSGALYFTDPPYGLAGGPEDPERDLDFCGVYRLSPEGKVTLLTREMTRPNGIGLSPDEKTLYVAQSDGAAAIWKAFPVRDDGTLGPSRVFFDATSMMGTAPGAPDGLKVDAAGNLFATGPGGVLVFAPDGTHLGTLNTGQATANCGWGEDGTVLYITADMFLCRVRTTTKGLGW